MNPQAAPSTAFATFPDELRTRPQWVVWKYKDRGGPKPTKPPYNAHTEALADHTNPSDWSTHEEALATYHRGGFDGIGFCFSKTDPYCGVDLDGSRDPQTGEIQYWARDIIARLDSYTEISPSGSGVHIITKATLADGGMNLKPIELYSSGRFFTVTANHLPETPTTPQERQEETVTLYADRRLYQKAKGAKNGRAFSTLWAGEWAGYPSQSEADQALTNVLAFWTKDPKQIDRLFRQSGLYRDKWDERHAGDGRTYGQLTIEKALASVKDRHSTSKGAYHGNGTAGPSAEEAFFQDDARESEAPHTAKSVLFTPVTRCMIEVMPETIHYLWYPYFPVGKLCLIGGDPGNGKTYLALSALTSLSLGRWPFTWGTRENERTPSNSLIFSCEDGVEDTLAPRLIGLGADRSHIFVVDGKQDLKGTLHRIVMTDTNVITQAIRDHQAKLAVFDPFQGFLPPHTKMNDMETVRPVVDALIKIAADTRCCIALLGHLSKAKQETVGYKFMGSVDWYAAARSALLILTDPENKKDGRILFQEKHTVGPKPPGVRFTIAEKDDPPFQWGQSTDQTAAEALAGDAGYAKQPEAREFLLGELALGARPVDELRKSAKQQRLAWRTIERAKKVLKVKARKEGFGETGKWVWELPAKTAAEGVF
jgi:putative DNA primase/helicase